MQFAFIRLEKDLWVPGRQAWCQTRLFLSHHTSLPSGFFMYMNMKIFTRFWSCKITILLGVNALRIQPRSIYVLKAQDLSQIMPQGFLSTLTQYMLVGSDGRLDWRRKDTQNPLWDCEAGYCDDCGALSWRGQLKWDVLLTVDGTGPWEKTLRKSLQSGSASWLYTQWGQLPPAAAALLCHSGLWPWTLNQNKIPLSLEWLVSGIFYHRSRKKMTKPAANWSDRSSVHFLFLFSFSLIPP